MKWFASSFPLFPPSELPYGWEKIEDPQFGTYYVEWVNFFLCLKGPTGLQLGNALLIFSHFTQMVHPETSGDTSIHRNCVWMFDSTITICFFQQFCRDAHIYQLNVGISVSASWSLMPVAENNVLRLVSFALVTSAVLLTRLCVTLLTCPHGVGCSHGWGFLLLFYSLPKTFFIWYRGFSCFLDTKRGKCQRRILI